MCSANTEYPTACTQTHGGPWPYCGKRMSLEASNSAFLLGMMPLIVWLLPGNKLHAV